MQISPILFSSRAYFLQLLMFSYMYKYWARTVCFLFNSWSRTTWNARPTISTRIGLQGCMGRQHETRGRPSVCVGYDVFTRMLSLTLLDSHRILMNRLPPSPPLSNHNILSPVFLDRRRSNLHVIARSSSEVHFSRYSIIVLTMFTNGCSSIAVHLSPFSGKCSLFSIIINYVCPSLRLSHVGHPSCNCSNFCPMDAILLLM
jgi:hypothetical protein